jgi:hypothetical protein
VAAFCTFGVSNIYRKTTGEFNCSQALGRDLWIKLKEGAHQTFTSVPLFVGMFANALARMNTIIFTVT